MFATELSYELRKALRWIDSPCGFAMYRTRLAPISIQPLLSRSVSVANLRLHQGHPQLPNGPRNVSGAEECGHSGHS
jgi:hypothetical protein